MRFAKILYFCYFLPWFICNSQTEISLIVKHFYHSSILPETSLFYEIWTHRVKNKYQRLCQYVITSSNQLAIPTNVYLVSFQVCTPAKTEQFRCDDRSSQFLQVVRNRIQNYWFVLLISFKGSLVSYVTDSWFILFIIKLDT